MSDEELDPEEEMLKRHRREKKELQSTVQVLKKAASKGDKKKKKATSEEIAKLEADLNEKHYREVKEFEEVNVASHTNSEVHDVACLTLSSASVGACVATTAADVSTAESSTTTAADAFTAESSTKEEEKPAARVSKAQKRRDKKAAKSADLDAEIAAQEEANLLGARHCETAAIKALLGSRGLAIREVPADGDCLFAGVAAAAVHQSSCSNLSVSELRRRTADVMLASGEDYMPFLSNPGNGEPLTIHEFKEYCSTMSETSAWGGQVELRALSHVLRQPIEVVQAEGPVIVVGEEYSSGGAEKVVLAYHRHYYGLGEHYNSVKQISS